MKLVLRRRRRHDAAQILWRHEIAERNRTGNCGKKRISGVLIGAERAEELLHRFRRRLERRQLLREFIHSADTFVSCRFILREELFEGAAAPGRAEAGATAAVDLDGEPVRLWLRPVR